MAAAPPPASSTFLLSPAVASCRPLPPPSCYQVKAEDCPPTFPRPFLCCLGSASLAATLLGRLLAALLALHRPFATRLLPSGLSPLLTPLLHPNFAALLATLFATPLLTLVLHLWLEA